jgi:hypothetical protein
VRVGVQIMGSFFEEKLHLASSLLSLAENWDSDVRLEMPQDQAALIGVGSSPCPSSSGRETWPRRQAARPPRRERVLVYATLLVLDSLASAR